MEESRNVSESEEETDAGEEMAAEPLPTCPIHELPISPGQSCPACRRELHVNKSWDD